MLPYRSRRLNSEIFKVLADSGKREFNAHSSILAAQSKPLEIIINRILAESGEKEIDLTAWDEDTVERFLDFLYSGDYEVDISEQPHSIAGSVTSELDTDTSRGDVYTPNTARSESSLSDKSDNTVHGDNRTDPLDRPLTPLWELYNPNHNAGTAPVPVLGDRVATSHPINPSYGPALLAHAKVYALAQLEDVKALQEMSLQRLLTALISLERFTANPDILAGIIALMRFVYDNTGSSGPGGEDEPMRRVVSQFAAINFPALERTAGMNELLASGGDLVTDLFGKVCRRLVHSEDQLEARRNGERTRNDDVLSLHLETTKCESKIQTLEETVRTERQGRHQAENLHNLLTDSLSAYFGTAMYVNVMVVTQEQFELHEGYDLAYWDDREQPVAAKPKSYKILKSSPLSKVQEMVAADLNQIDAGMIRLWPVVDRLNKTCRPERPFSTPEMAMRVENIAEKSRLIYRVKVGFRVWAEIMTAGTSLQKSVFGVENDRIVLHLKHFDFMSQRLSGVGHQYMGANDTTQDLTRAIILRMGWATDQRVSLYEEIKPGMISSISPGKTLSEAELRNGDIICFQKPCGNMMKLLFKEDQFLTAPNFYSKSPEGPSRFGGL